MLAALVAGARLRASASGHEADATLSFGFAGVRKAAARKLEHELGIPTKFELDEFAYLTRIHYYAPSDAIWAEHESKHERPADDRQRPARNSHSRLGRPFAVDYILFLTHDPKFVANPNEVSDTKWVSKADLQAFFADTSKQQNNAHSRLPHRS